MSSFLVDTFAGTAGTALESHTPGTGGAWAKSGGQTGGVQLVGNGRARLVDASGTVEAVYANAATPGSADYDVEADLYFASVAAASYLSLGARMNGATLGGNTGGFLGGFDGGTTWKLYNGTNPLTSVAASVSAGQTCHVKLTVRGSALNLYVDNALTVGPVSNSSYASAGNAGLFVFSTAAVSDTTGVHVANMRAVDSGTALVSPAPAAGTATGTTVPLTWGHALGGTSTYSYQVQRAPDSSGSPGTFANVGSAVTTTSGTTGSFAYTDTGLTAGTTYWYRVVTTDSAGSPATANSTAASATTTGGAASFTVSPSTVPANHAGGLTLTLTGTGTTWSSGSTVSVTNSLTGTTTVTKGTWTRTGNTAATLTVTTGSGTGTFKITVDAVDSGSLSVATASFTVSPASGPAGVSKTVTATGTNTLWTQETASTLFSVSGGSGASVSSISVASDTSATFTLSPGSPATLTLTATPTGATATYAVAVASNVTFVGDSLTYGQNASSGAGTAGGTTYPGVVMGAVATPWYSEGNFGVQSKRINEFPTTTLDAHVNASAAANILCVLGGTNDINGTNDTPADAPTTYARLVAYCQGRRAAGWKVAVLTLPPADLVSHTFDATRDAVNTSIRANWRSFADAIADVAFDGRVGQDGQWSNATYFNSDKTHLTDAGYAIVGQYAAAAVAAAVGNGGVQNHKVRFRLGAP